MKSAFARIKLRPTRALRLVFAGASVALCLMAALDIGPARSNNGRFSPWIGSAQAAEPRTPSIGDAIVIQASDGKYYYAVVDRLYQDRGVDMVAFRWQAGNRYGQGYMPASGRVGKQKGTKLFSVDEARSKNLNMVNDLASTNGAAPNAPTANSHRNPAASTDAGGSGGAAATATPAAEPASGPLDAGARKDMLATHDQWRSQVGVGPLTWSDKLAASAQDWAEHIRETRSCRIDESAHSQRADIGENLAYYSPMRFSSGKTRQQAIDPARVLDDWGREKRFYDYASNRCSGVCGHYTQVVWRDTKQVGCGRAVCQDQSQVWVCQYSPPGNYMGQKPY